MLQVWGRRNSLNVQKVMWLIGELDLPHWMDWFQSSLQPAFLNGIFWGYYRTPEAQRDWKAIEASLRQCAGYLQHLERILSEQAFLAGEHLTLADIPAGSMLYRYFELDIERPKLPNIEAWYARLQLRPAYREHVMVPFDEMRGRLEY